MEQHQVVPVRIGLKCFEVAEYGPSAIFVAQECAAQAARQFRRNFPQCEHIAGTGRKFDLEVLAQIVMKLLQRFDKQEVHRKPDRTAPVGIAAKKSG